MYICYGFWNYLKNIHQERLFMMKLGINYGVMYKTLNCLYVYVLWILKWIWENEL